MPKASIESATATPGPQAPRKEPHERMNGPWDHWELDEASHHLHHAAKIGKNPKFLEAIKRHEEKRATEHHEGAKRAELLAKHGKISDRQLAKMHER